MEYNEPQTRSRRKRIRVTFPDGEAFCYTDATLTMLAALAKIGPQRFPEIKLEIGKLPIMTREPYPRYKQYMREVCDGWWLNTQSDSKDKYLQLKAISDTLALGLKIEIGEDLPTQAKPGRPVRRKSKDTLRVHFPEDDTYIALESPQDVFLETVRKIGVNRIINRKIPWKSYLLVTRIRESPRQIEVDGCWTYIPPSVKDKATMLHVIALSLRIPLEVSIV